MKMAENGVAGNACVVSVMQIVGPSTFWVTKSPENDMAKEREKINYLEEMLSVQSQRSFQGVNYVPEEGELVAVQHPGTGHWHRGEVEYMLHVAKGCVYKVFLVDHGLSVQVLSSAIRKLPVAWNSLDYQAFQVVLYGVLPTTVEMDYEDMKMKRKVASSWTAAALKFVEDLLEKSTKSWFVEKKNIKKKSYGDLLVELENESLSLSNVLCNKEYAVLSEELFEEALLLKCDMQQEQQFCRTPSPQSPVCPDSRRDQSTSRVCALGDDSKRHHIGDYIHERNVQWTKKKKKNLNQTEEWRREDETGCVDEHERGECVQSDTEETLGHGILLQKRKEISPGAPSNVEQVRKCNENSSLEASHGGETKPSSPSSILGLLDLIDDDSNCDSKSMSEPDTSWNPLCDGKKNSSVEYLPAGANLNVCNKKSKDARDTKSTPLRKERKATGVKNDSHTAPFKITSNCDTFSDITSSQSTNSPLDTERNEVHNSVIKHSEHCDKIAMKKQQKLGSSLECLKMETSSSNDCRTENIGGVPRDVTKKETPVSTRSFFQVIANNVEKSTQARSPKGLYGVKNNSFSPNSTPDMKAGQPKAALGAVLKQEASGTDIRVKRVNSFASVEDAVLPTEEFPTVPVECMVSEQHQVSQILVHGDMELRSIRSVAEANFPREIHQALARMELKNPMRIQTYAWPAILRGHYTILVGPPQSGKTLGYIVPLVSFMFVPDLYSELRPGNGPLVLVLCSGSRSAQFIYEKCCTLLKFSNQNKVRVELAHGGGREGELKHSLANGCDILISTPPCFKRLMCCSRLITNVDRLAYLVLDEVDILAQKFLSELKGIITECKQMLVRRAKLGVPVQVIAASEKWCPTVEQFLQQISHNFVVCISACLEAAVYAKLKPSLHYLSTSSKPEAVLDILDGSQGQYKTVIICNSAAEVDELVPFLESQCFHVLAAHEDMTLHHNVEICHLWKCSVVLGSHPVLVCTDDVLPELDISDAMWLIHYSLPHTKTSFGFRFSCLMKSYPNMFQKSTSKDDSPECKVHIFADIDQNIRELPEIVRFLKRLSVPIAPDIEAKAVEIVRQKESEKLGFPLCYYVKAFGECLEQSVCRSRHIMMDTADKPSGIPTRGEVKVKILHVHNASSFSARLLEHTDIGGFPVPVPDEYFTVNMAVYSHYSDERNRLLHGIPKLGDICSLESKINFFQRVQVVGIVKEDTKGIPEELQVKFLDEGTFSVVKVYQLLALPEELQQLSPQVVDIFLCNVMPCDLDTGWSETATHTMNDWINNINSEEENGQFVVGKVMLSVGYTLWLEPLQCCKYLPNVGTHVREFSLSKEIINCRLAVNNPGHLDKLYELCRAGGLAVPSYEKAVPALEKVQSKIQTLPSPQWAHLDNKEFQPIASYSVENPHMLFIRQYKFHDIFQGFVRELQKCVKTKPEDFHLEEGTYCLGKFPNDGLWCRARVDQLLEDDCALLFFVDYGDSACVNIDDIAPITEMQIKKLPFQAIECSLAGIKSPVGGIWSEEATDAVCEFADNSRGLYVKVCEVMTAVHTGGRKYSVVLVDVGSGTDVYLNKVLLERNLAIPDNIEQILEKLAAVDCEANDTSEESDVEPGETEIVKLSEIKISQHATLPSAEDSVWEEEGFEFVMDSPQNFVRLNNNCKPTLPALPSSEYHSTEGDASSRISAHSFLSDDEGDDTDYIPSLVSTTRTPEVLWHQDDCIIYIKIMLTGVQKYYIGWNMMHLQFSTEINSQVYEVTMDLYGPINVANVTHAAGGFFVHIKMMKFVTGCYWARLLRSQSRQPWLKSDLEKYCDSDEDNVKTRCERALKELSSPCKKSHVATTSWKDKAAMSSVHIRSTIDDDDDDDDNDDSNDDDVVDQQNELYDPYDPLN